MTEQIRIIDAKEHVNEEVKIGAWLTDKRSSGKIAFLQLRDGSAYFQGVVSKADVPEEVFSLAKELRQESSMWITGVIHQDSRSHFGYEIEVRTSNWLVIRTTIQSPRRSTASNFCLIIAIYGCVLSANLQFNKFAMK